MTDPNIIQVAMTSSKLGECANPWKHRECSMAAMIWPSCLCASQEWYHTCPFAAHNYGLGLRPVHGAAWETSDWAPKKNLDDFYPRPLHRGCMVKGAA